MAKLATPPVSRSGLSGMAATALQIYLETVVDLARGGEVDPAAVQGITIAAGRSIHQLQADVERCAERIERHAAYEATDYKSRMEANLVERRDLSGTLEELQRQKDEIQEKLRAAHERNKTLLSAGSRIQDESRRSRNELTDFMRSTGDISDPEEFALSD